MAGSSAMGDRQTLTANGTTTFRRFIGPVRLSLTNDFGTGTAKLQCKDPSDATVDVANGSFTATTDTIFDFPVGAINELAVNLASSSGPDLDIWIQGHRQDDDQNP